MAGIAVQDTEEDLLDDRPIALRRKKRSSSSLANPGYSGQADEGSISDDAGSEHPKTPTKRNKRVRFSAPGSERVASSSTGLTPFLKRTILMPKVASSPPLKLGLRAKNPRKRASLPSNLSDSLPSPSLTPPPAQYTSGEVQFEPFREVLDERMKRRLRRNNMSEELNDIAADRKRTSQLTREVQDLKDELALAKQLNQEVKDSLGEKDNSERIQELEEQIAVLKHDKRERSTTVDSSLAPTEYGSTTPIAGDSNDGDVDRDFISVSNDGDEHLDGNLDVNTSNQATSSTVDATTQASTPLATYIAGLQAARMSLERLFPGEIPLGLNIEDPGPLLNTMIDRLHNMRTQTILVQESLSTSKTLEANLRNNFNSVVQQLGRSRHQAEHLSEQLASAKEQGDKAGRRIQHLESSIQQESGRVKELEAELVDKDLSIQRLQDALQSYRDEVSKLESLVSSLEEEHNASISELRDQHNEELADLHCEVAAETTGRKAAEKEAVERGQRIKQLEYTERELKRAMNEKQKTIRDMEREIVEVKEMHERETGTRNVTMARLSSNLQEAYDQLSRMEGEKNKLIEMVAEEIAAGAEAIGAIHATSIEAGEAIQGATDMILAEMARYSETVNQVKETHANGIQSRGAEVVEHRGLLTPVAACRFKEVEGHVEVKRGKAKGKRPDSGIAGLEEDDLEDIMEEDA